MYTSIFRYDDGAMHFIYSHKYNTTRQKIHLIYTEYYSEHNVHNIYVIALYRARTPIA